LKPIRNRAMGPSEYFFSASWGGTRAGQGFLGFLSACLLGVAMVGGAYAAEKGGTTDSVLDFQARRLSGASESLESYRGQVLLIVNTASKCGYTPQYEGLEALYEKYKGQGFSVLGFPSNDFGAQEPGTDSEIGSFCKRNYGVEFPMFSKVKVRGEGQHALYAYLTTLPAPIGGPIRWNFQKYLVDRAGQVVSSFPSAVKPTSPEIVAPLEALLAVQSPKPDREGAE
jgi:glutathione peroxidase